MKSNDRTDSNWETRTESFAGNELSRVVAVVITLTVLARGVKSRLSDNIADVLDTWKVESPDTFEPWESALRKFLISAPEYHKCISEITNIQMWMREYSEIMAIGPKEQSATVALEVLAAIRIFEEMMRYHQVLLTTLKSDAFHPSDEFVSRMYGYACRMREPLLEMFITLSNRY